jgi:SnoaL-like domain
MPVSALPSTAAVATELVELCRAGRNLEAIDRLYSPNIESMEPLGDEQMPAELHGIEAVRAKNEWWFNNHDIHRAEVNGPFLGDDQFAVQYSYDITFKPTGRRTNGTEMALYTVVDGRIVREQFFYHIPSDEADAG